MVAIVAVRVSSTEPVLLVTGDRRWLFYQGFDWEVVCGRPVHPQLGADGSTAAFTEPGAVEPLGNLGLVPGSQSSQPPREVREEFHVLAGAGTSGCPGDPVKRNLAKSTGTTGPSEGKFSAGLLAWRGCYKFNLGTPHQSSSQADSKRSLCDRSSFLLSICERLGQVC